MFVASITAVTFMVGSLGFSLPGATQTVLPLTHLEMPVCMTEQGLAQEPQLVDAEPLLMSTYTGAADDEMVLIEVPSLSDFYFLQQ